MPAVPVSNPAAAPGCRKAVVLVAHGWTKGDTVPGTDSEQSDAAAVDGAACQLLDQLQILRLALPCKEGSCHAVRASAEGLLVVHALCMLIAVTSLLVLVR